MALGSLCITQAAAFSLPKTAIMSFLFVSVVKAFDLAFGDNILL